MLPSSSSPKPLPTHPLNLLHFPLCLAGDLLVTRCSVFTLVTESCSFSCPLCSSLWLFFLLLPSFTTSAWKENWSGIKFLPNLLSQTHVLFQKIYSSATFCWLLQLLPLIPLILSIRSQWFDLSQSIHWLLDPAVYLTPGKSFALPAPLFAFLLPPPLFHRHRHLTEQWPLSPSQCRKHCKYTSCLIGKHFNHCS